MSKFGWILPILLLDVTGASAADVDLAKGQLTHDGSYTTQVVATKNNTGDVIQMLWVECGFFRKGMLLGAGKGYAENVKPGQTAYIEVASNHTEGSDNADCRVQSVD
jgi:hypothetical protein